MTRARLALLFLPTLLILGLAAALAWLLRTESGALWALSRVDALVPGSLTVSELAGDLDSGLRFGSLQYADDSVVVRAAEVRLQLAFDLLPPAVSVKSLEVDQITLRPHPAVTSADTISADELLDSLALPFPVSFDLIRIDRLQVQDSGGADLFSGRSFNFSGRWHERLTIRHAGIASPSAEWQLDGRIDFSPPFPLDATLTGRFQPARAAPPGAPVSTLEARFKGSLEELETQAGIDQPAAELTGHVRHVLTHPELDLQLTASSLAWPPAVAQPALSVHAFTADLSGPLNDYRLSARGEVIFPELPGASIELLGHGNADGFQLDQFAATGELADVAAEGSIRWTEALQLQLHTRVERLDPSAWLGQWPAEHALQGQVEIGLAENGLRFEGIEFTAADTGLEVTGQGVLDLGQDRIEAALAWKQLQWPPGSEEPEFSSRQGELRVQGKPDDWTAAGQFDLQAGNFPAGQLTVNGRGDTSAAQVQIERGQVLGGRFRGQFNYNWSGARAWSAAIDASDIDISSLAPAYPGVISADLELRGQADPSRLDIEIRALNGVLRQQAIEASGSLMVGSGQVWAKDLRIRSGPSHVWLDGNIQDREGIRFSGRVESLAAFVDRAGGTLSGEGRISSQPEHPLVELQLQGSQLSWGDLRIASLAAGPLDDLDTGTGHRLELSGVEIGDRYFDSISVAASGITPLEDILLKAASHGMDISGELAGSVHHWDDLGRLEWQGTVRSLQVSSGQLGYLDLKDEAALRLSASHLHIGPACFLGVRKGTTCVELGWDENERLAINARLDAVSLNLAQLLLGTDLQFTQTLSGELLWEATPGAQPRADVRVQISPGELSDTGEEILMRTGPGVFGFRIEDGQLMSGDLDMLIPDTGLINIDFSAPDISRGIDSPVEGRIRIELNQISALAQWLPAVDGISGSVNADARLAGTLADPKLTGHASLVRGKLEHHASGVMLEDIQLAGAVYEFDYTEFNGSFRSGDGRGRIKATVDFGNLLKPVITMELTGQDLTLINVPDMTVTANPDLRLSYQDSELQLDGSILIPAARISPSYLPTTNAAESEDLLIVAGEKPEVETPLIDRSRLRLNGSVSVELGEDITVTFERATAQLSGKAVFSWDKSLLPVADGTYTVSGKITAYGQLLEVSEGRVSFPHVPADNPHLNIRAEREIYGNVQIKRAGVLISGTLKNPVLETYTSPLTTEERALTLLLTGSDFNYEQGVGGVEVGMYIAPRLYVSYGIGLFDNQSVISARYDLKRGFGIKATSGQRETGADLSYTIER